MDSLYGERDSIKTPFKKSYPVFNPSKTKKLLDVKCDYSKGRADITLDTNFGTENMDQLIRCLEQLKTVGITRWTLRVPGHLHDSRSKDYSIQ